jgi:hypothetical protein
MPPDQHKHLIAPIVLGPALRERIIEAVWSAPAERSDDDALASFNESVHES